ncbi:calnexin-like [Onthophagus taurus]|uniref:calnexin-like n=1 Tax=Onthophagus taurus TaxID=166361 RepID=UPI000C2049FA|nr:calnexin-like [Onthophagus taurus]
MKVHHYLGLFCLVLALTYADDIDDSDEVTVEIEEEPIEEVTYSSPTPSDSNKVYIAEHFDDESKFAKTWVKSEAKKEGISEDISKYDGFWAIESPTKDGLKGDKGLVLKSKAKHSAISSRLSRPFIFNTKPLVVQYEVLFQDGQECGGAYLKLLTDGVETKNLNHFHDKTPYTIMFGPDKCGTDHKLHFIFRHVNPKNASIEEKHCKKPKERIDDFFTDKLPHLYTLILKPDNSFEVMVDNKLINSGSLLDDFTPPVNPPEEIDDPKDKKPADWDEREKIPDPEAVKPEDWDEDAPAQIVDENAEIPDGWLEEEPKHIPDPDAIKPDDWDTEMDGDWEAPLIDNPTCANSPGCGKWEPPLINNPKYKGKWNAPLIDNPNYKGKWKPKRIPNPDYFEDKHPFKMQSISAVGFELWSMSDNILFDNLIITEEMRIADEWAAATFEKKRLKIAKDSESIVEKLAKLTTEYPALWIVYILGLSIPVILILYVCCKPSSPASQESNAEPVSTKKKTDDLTPDDIPPAEPINNEEDEDKEKYSDQEGEEEEEKDQVEGEVEPEVAPEIVEEIPPNVPETRKRKPRKE